MFEPLENLVDEADTRFQRGGEAVTDVEEQRKCVISIYDT